MKPIGGYFGFEEALIKQYHSNALAVNSGRSALELIIREHAFSKIYAPVYTCSEVKNVLKKCAVEVEYYAINASLEPVRIFDLENDTAMLITNYFGIKDAYLSGIAGQNVIIDNAQAFYYKNEKQIGFNSARKFFGVLDGSFLYLQKPLSTYPLRFEQPEETRHLIMRHMGETEKGYAFYQEAEHSPLLNSLNGMSFYSDRILRSVDHKAVIEIRRINYNYLNSRLKGYNKLDLMDVEQEVPMVYPFLPEQRMEKQQFYSKKIFISTYWPNVLEEAAPGSFEYELVENGLFLPVDHRYTIDDMNTILNLILN